VQPADIATIIVSAPRGDLLLNQPVVTLPLDT
jgi:hypothetical protein